MMTKWSYSTYLQWLEETTPILSHTVSISNDLTYSVSAYNHHNLTLPKTPGINDIDSLLYLLSYVTTLKICPGISDPKYLLVAEKRNGKLLNREGFSTK